MLYHDFILQTQLPENLIYSDFNKELFIKISDQFIDDYSDIYKNVRLYWNNFQQLNYGFNYYGTTIIDASQAQELLNTINLYLENNQTEKAEYFKGEELDKLVLMLKNTIETNGYLIHFGI